MLSYRLAGEGPPLLLIHGWGVTFPIWHTLAPLLSPHFQLIMVELPGHGASPETPASSYFAACATSLEELRVHLEIEQWDILSYSIGAWAGRVYYECYPARVRRLIFLSPLFLRGWRLAGLRFVCWSDALFPQGTDFILNSFVFDLLLVVFGFSGQIHPYRKVWRQEIRSQPLPILKKMAHHLPKSFVAQKPQVPHLHLWGRDDILAAPPVPLPAGDVLISGTHAAPMLAQHEIAQRVLEFLR